MRIKEWFKNVDLFAFLCYFILVIMLASAILGACFAIYEEAITHYDITVTYITGENQVVHCLSYYKKNDYLICNVNGETCSICLENVLCYDINGIECDCINV